MNSDHLNRYTSLPLNGTDFSFPEFNLGNGNDELSSMNSYYSMQNVQNTNPYYRPYETALPDEWPWTAAANSAFGRNLYATAAADYATGDNSSNPHSWQIPPAESAYYSHFNANLWPQLYVPSYHDNYHDFRYPPLPELAPSTIIDETSNCNSGFLPPLDFQADNNHCFPGEPPSTAAVLPPFDPTITFCNVQPPLQMVAPDGPKPPVNILPNNTMATSDLGHEGASFQCHLCHRFCVSAGGLKRHAKFCRASPSNLEHIFATLKRSSSASGGGCALPGNISFSEYHSVTMTPCGNAVMTTVINNVPAKQQMIQPQAIAPAEVNRSVVPIESFGKPSETIDLSKPIKTDSARRRTCPQCPVVVTSERALVTHLTTHNVRKPYECEACGSRFSRKFHLTRHVKQRGCDGRPRAQFPCQFCQKIFSRKDNLREHVKGHTGQSRPRTKLPCPIPSCSKKFQGRTQLQVHLNAHSGLRPYACDRCEKTFRSNAALKKHCRVHSGEKPFNCTECDARFVAKETLNRHMLTHTCERPHTCNDCGKGFIQPLQLKAHINNQHQAEETFKCSMCERSYKRRWRLQQHYRIEHNERKTAAPEEVQPPVENKVAEKAAPTHAHVCDACGKSFALKQSLKVHFLTHVREPPVSCTQCSRAFIRRDCLLRHLRTKHRLVHNEALQALQNMTQPEQPSYYQPKGFETEPPLPGCSDMNNNNPSILPSNAPAAFNYEAQDMLEGNILELLCLLMDRSALTNFGWPECSVDYVLQTVLKKCGQDPVTSDPSYSLMDRLRANTKLLFSFIVDDQSALETLFSKRPIEEVLEQVIDQAKPTPGNADIVTYLF